MTSGQRAPRSALPQQGTATGSGFVVDKDGYIITNAHVVEGADSVQVSFDENGEFVDAEVKGVDTSTDVAVLKIDPVDVRATSRRSRWATPRRRRSATR